MLFPFPNYRMSIPIPAGFPLENGKRVFPFSMHCRPLSGTPSLATALVEVNLSRAERYAQCLLMASWCDRRHCNPPTTTVRCVGGLAYYAGRITKWVANRTILMLPARHDGTARPVHRHADRSRRPKATQKNRWQRHRIVGLCIRNLYSRQINASDKAKWFFFVLAIRSSSTENTQIPDGNNSLRGLQLPTLIAASALQHRRSKSYAYPYPWRAEASARLTASLVLKPC